MGIWKLSKKGHIGKALLIIIPQATQAEPRERVLGSSEWFVRNYYKEIERQETKMVNCQNYRTIFPPKIFHSPFETLPSP